MRSLPPRAACVLLLLAAALAVRLAAGVWWQERLTAGRMFGFGDSETYWRLGQTIASGEPYEYQGDRVFRMPGYPLLLAGLFRLAGAEAAPLWGRALSAALGTLAVAAVMGWANMLFSARAALIAGVLAAFYPEAVASGAFVLSEAPFTPLMVLQLWLWGAAWRDAVRSKGSAVFSPVGQALPDGQAKLENLRDNRIRQAMPDLQTDRDSDQPAGNSSSDATALTLPSPGGRGVPAVIRGATVLAILAGLAGAGATYMRPSWLLFTPLAAAVGVALANKELRRRQAWIGATVCLALAAGMTPWWMRNALVTGHFVPTTLQVGASLYDGLNPEADGGSQMSFVPRFVAAERDWSAQQTGEPADTFEYRLDRRMRDAALHWAGSHPADAARLAAIKFSRLWNVWPNEAAFRSWPLRLVVLFTYTPLVALGLYGAWRLRGCGWPCVLAWLPAVYFTLLHVIFVSSIRYREPPMLALIVLAAGVLAEWFPARPTNNKVSATPAIP